MASFRAWLQQKYATIGDLNSAWGNFYLSFDVRLPAPRASRARATVFRTLIPHASQSVRMPTQYSQTRGWSDLLRWRE